MCQKGFAKVRDCCVIHSWENKMDNILLFSRDNIFVIANFPGTVLDTDMRTKKKREDIKNKFGRIKKTRSSGQKRNPRGQRKDGREDRKTTSLWRRQLKYGAAV